MSAARSIDRLLFAAVLLACFASAVRGSSSQISRPAAAVISGRVVDAMTGRPVRGATVALGGVRGYTPGFFTGGDGRFQFSDAPIGHLELNATK
ncbi:MAG TPA: carboxypeptidase regulatory-like domain-containing protein, partial [Vicinamibacterales bacterium]|nr:carboxypeptidase regulatory-like domain-containing protein [Vicinamibacterales bacterium]